MTHQCQVYPVTFEQEAMWLHDCLYERQSLYLEYWVCRLRGDVDLAAADWAVRQIVARHAALHSSIRFDGRQLIQVPQADRPVDIEWLCCPEQSLDAELQRLIRRPLDVSDSPLRVTYLDVAPGDVVLVWQVHHLVVDDWAWSILERDFQELYCAHVAGRPAQLPPLPLQPGEYATAQRDNGVDPELADFWRERLKDAPLESTVPADYAPAEVPGHQGGLIRFHLDANLGDGVRALARQSRTTPFTVVAATVAALLRAFNGSADQVLGTVVSRRGPASLDQMLTCLADLLPLRLRVRPEDSFAELVTSAKRVVSETVAHRNIPFTVLLDALRRPRNPRRPPLCQVVLVVDDVPKATLDLPRADAERLYVHSGISKFDLGITLVLNGAGYQGFLVYASALFTQETAQAIQDGFCALLERAVAQPDSSLGEIFRSLPLSPPGKRK